MTMTILRKCKNGCCAVLSYIYYNLIFKTFGWRSRIGRMPLIEGGKYVSIASRVTLYNNVSLQALKLHSEYPEIIIKSRTRIWHNCQISAISSVLIEEGCAIASNVFITDCTHDYYSIDIDVTQSGIIPLASVVIGRGTWIGRNSIISGCKIGKHCIIGANTFVKSDIPDYCVVVGNPSRIIKRYDKSIMTWRKTDPLGNFID